MATYRSRFEAAFDPSPFRHWIAGEAFSAIFKQLVDDLVEAGESASDQIKLGLLFHTVQRLNVLNQEDSNMIETGEREELCSLVNLVATACGLDPVQYGNGEGPASDWREW